MKNHLVAFALTILAIGCNKNNGNTGGGTTPANPNKDVDNFITIDGVTNYHYIYPNIATVANNFVPNSLEIAQWANINTNEPDHNVIITLSQQIYKTPNDTNWLSSITLSHKANNTLKNYGHNFISKKPLFQRAIVNGIYVYNFNNIKVFEGNGMDSTGIVKYFSGKITCNGK